MDGRKRPELHHAGSLKHHREKPDDFWINRYTKGVYDDTSLIHRNIVFADTLEVIENVILFSISNYFLRFSNEFRRIKGDDELDANNWYEYVEYGTTNPLTILLQRNGFSRESARFIKENPEYVVKDGSTGKLKLRPRYQSVVEPAWRTKSNISGRMFRESL